MTLNNIQLSPSLLTNMYRSSLIEANEAQKTRKKAVGESPMINPVISKNDILAKDPIAPDSYRDGWKYLGEYKKNILLVVRYQTATYIPDEPLNFLTSVLGACKLSLGDIAILNLTNAPSVLHKDIQNKFTSSVTILFGLTPEELEMPVNFPEFQVQAFNNCTFLHTPTLEKLETDKVLKSKLWVCLRKMFNLP